MSTSSSPWEVDINTLVADRQAFNSFVYTPLSEAMTELKRRREDKKLGETISELLSNDIPPVLAGPSIKAVLFRQLVTPNYEVRRFFHLIEGLNDLEPLFWEYYEDKFTSNNDWKRSLGKLKFFMGVGHKKEGRGEAEHVTVVDFAKYDGKKISSVKTTWGQPLVAFHHELFDKTYRTLSEIFFFDSSEWFKRNGHTADIYYTSFFRLFIKNAILFENFMLDSKELSFSKHIFLPAFIKVFQETGYKPLIVALEPTEIEGDGFWFYHPGKSKQFVERKKTKTLTTFLMKLLSPMQKCVEKLLYA